MAKATKSKYEETIDEIMDGIAQHLSSLPRDERRNRIRAAVFVNAILDPPAPNKGARMAAARYKKDMGR